MQILPHGNDESTSSESMDPKVSKLPRERNGVKRDWEKPGLTKPSKMFKPYNKPTPNIMEFEKETGVRGTEASHPGPMAERNKARSLRKRDASNASQSHLGVAEAASTRHARTQQH